MIPARTVLDAHTELYELLKHPPEALVRYFDYYVTEGRKVVEQHRQTPYEGLSAEESAVLAGWEYYTWPAVTGLDLIRLVAGPLFAAPTYQVTGEIVDAVTGMYQTTADGKPVLRASDMPSPTGFAYLDEPVTFTDFSATEQRVCAISWGPQRFAPDGLQPAKGVRITTWTAGNPTRLEWDSSLFVPYGQPVADNISDDPTRWLHCLWLFMGTEIVTADRAEADRASRRRAQKSGRPRTDVTVIMLRRGISSGTGDHRDIDWSCRWVVQSHARHLEDYRPAYEHHQARVEHNSGPCLVCGARTTHIGAYVKGPQGKPLKPTAKLYRVSR